MENKYQAGQTVFAIINPTVMLVVRRYVDRIYYCRLKDVKSEKELVYFERELNGVGTDQKI